MVGHIEHNSEIRSAQDNINTSRKNIANLAMQIAAEEELLNDKKRALEIDVKIAKEQASKLTLPADMAGMVISDRVRIDAVLISNQRPTLVTSSGGKTITLNFKSTSPETQFSDKTGPSVVYTITEFSLRNCDKETIKGFISFPICLGKADNKEVLIPMCAMVKGYTDKTAMLETKNTTYLMSAEALMAEKYTTNCPSTVSLSTSGADVMKAYEPAYLIKYDGLWGTFLDMDINKFLTVAHHDLDATGALVFLLKFIAAAEEEVYSASKWKESLAAVPAAAVKSFPKGVDPTTIQTSACIGVNWRSARQLSTEEIQKMRDERTREKEGSSQTSSSSSSGTSSSPTPTRTTTAAAGRPVERQCSFCGTRVARYHECKGCGSVVCPPHAYEFVRPSDSETTHWCQSCFGTQRFNDYSRGGTRPAATATTTGGDGIVVDATTGSITVSTDATF